MINLRIEKMVIDVFNTYKLVCEFDLSEPTPIHITAQHTHQLHRFIAVQVSQDG